jgi:uncharacterized protein (TIGR03083 family)
MENSRFLECLESDFRRLRGIVPGHLDARVPSCPEWSVDDLTWHVGMVYLHKATSIREGAEPTDWPPHFDDSYPALELIDRAYGDLVGEFAAHPPEENTGTWYGPDQTVGFWIRRMAQETVIHRIDAELGTGQPVAPVPDDLAIDGIDELLRVFVAFNVSEWSDYFTEALAGSPGRSVAIEAGDTAWRIAISPGKFTVERRPAEKATGTTQADATISGSPAAVLRWGWNRESPGEPSAVTITGDQDALAEFRRCVVIATQLQLAADHRWRGAQDALRCHRAEEPLKGDFDVLAPGQGGAEFHAQPRVTMVRADGLEADRQQVLDGEHTGGGRPLLVTKGLDRPDTPPGEVLRHALYEHPSQAAAGELAEHPRGHEQDRVGTHRTGGEGDRSWHVQRRSIKDVGGRDSVDVEELAAAAPFKQHGGDP